MFFARPNGWLFSMGMGVAVSVVFFVIGMIFGKLRGVASPRSEEREPQTNTRERTSYMPRW